jgi:uncharacterized damage-inducible protein DinB
MSDRSGLEAYLHLLAEAFRGLDAEEGDESPALLPNIATVPESAWRALPQGSARSIESIAVHVGACKIMYDDYAFGGGTLRFATPEVEPWVEGEAPRADVVAWLEEAHDRLAGHVAALAHDSELDRPRLTNWGEHRSTRWIVTTMINHDTYHAGEINHLRSMLGDDDRWRHVQLGYG